MQILRKTDLVGKGVHWNTERPRQTKVTKLQLAFPVDKQVLRLEITVKDPVLVAEGGALEKLIHEAPDCDGVEGAAIAVNIHVLLEVPFAKLEDEHELRLGVYHVVESDDVDMLQLLHERDLADGGGRRSFLCIKVDFLQGDDLVCCSRATLFTVLGSALSRVDEYHTL